MPQREEGANCSQDQGREAQPPALSPGLSPPRRAPTLHGAARAGTLRTQSRGRGGGTSRLRPAAPALLHLALSGAFSALGAFLPAPRRGKAAQAAPPWFPVSRGCSLGPWAGGKTASGCPSPISSSTVDTGARVGTCAPSGDWGLSWGHSMGQRWRLRGAAG